MGEWFDVKVSGRRPATAEMFELDLDVGGTPLEGTHTLPGQYVRLRAPGGKESFFAIASTPGDDPRRLEFLIKRGGEVANALETLTLGDHVEISAIEGKGFPVEAARGRDVLLFATGSGLSALRSLIGVLARERVAFKKITLFFGVRRPDAFAYAHEFEEWQRAGIEAVRTVSQPGSSGWEGLTGHVQHHVPEAPLHDAVAFVCGQKGMVQGVTAALAERGMPADRIFQNF